MAPTGTRNISISTVEPQRVSVEVLDGVLGYRAKLITRCICSPDKRGPWIRFESRTTLWAFVRHRVYGIDQQLLPTEDTRF